jgi:5-(carboxyamino)imidazole ribonucleotide mutase
MKGRQVFHREALARLLEDWAVRLRAGRSIRVGSTLARVAERAVVETEVEVKRGRVELELEIGWPAATPDNAPLVGIVTGSPNDMPTVTAARDRLGTLGIPCEVRVMSAHRTPDLVLEYVRNAEERGIDVIIACAGMANHLSGTVAAHCHLPVIGVPLRSGGLGGLDSLLSTVQMPAGVPVATVAIDGAGNAAFLAARVLALKYPEIRARLEAVLVAERARYEAASREAARQATPASSPGGRSTGPAAAGGPGPGGKRRASKPG